MTFSFVPQAYAASTAWTGDCVENGVATIGGIKCLIGNILTPLPGLIALCAVGMIIFAGIRIINAGSSEKEYTAGWNTFTYAVIGLILLSVVWLAIILIQKYTGANDITNFGIN